MLIQESKYICFLNGVNVTNLLRVVTLPPQVYDTVLSVCTGLDELETVHVEARLNMLERLIKSSVLGLILPPMLCLLCDRKLHTLYFSETLLQVGVVANICYLFGTSSHHSVSWISGSQVHGVISLLIPLPITSSSYTSLYCTLIYKLLL